MECPYAGRSAYYTYLKHATLCPSWFAMIGGVILHSGLHSAHLVQKGQPSGAWMGLGTSPSSLILFDSLAFLGSAMGAALRSALV